MNYNKRIMDKKIESNINNNLIIILIHRYYAKQIISVIKNSANDVINYTVLSIETIHNDICLSLMSTLYI